MRYDRTLQQKRKEVHRYGSKNPILREAVLCISLSLTPFAHHTYYWYPSASFIPRYNSEDYIL
jgi:hypothetical protein